MMFCVFAQLLSSNLSEPLFLTLKWSWNFILEVQDRKKGNNINDSTVEISCSKKCIYIYAQYMLSNLKH